MFLTDEKETLKKEGRRSYRWREKEANKGGGQEKKEKRENMIKERKRS